jgi:hypothetical protein
VQAAHFQMRLARETDSPRPAVTLLPFFQECQTSSHLPATALRKWGDERLLLSDASWAKRRASFEGRFEHGDEAEAGWTSLWSGWMRHLAEQRPGRWPDPQLWFRRLRCDDTSAIPKAARRRAEGRRSGYLGLVYSDGNAMGRLVQQLPDPQTYAAFSEMVDDSVRTACHEALERACADEIERVRAAWDEGGKVQPLPADILLLGGDDLMVLLPAERALPFALHATAGFERLTAEAVRYLPAGPARDFFDGVLQGRGLTLSCGVALGPASYPFHLLFDLAEALLKSAKKGGSADPTRNEFWAPPYIDFHLITGAASDTLGPVRKQDYLAESPRPRTLRPYRRDRLEALQGAAARLARGRLPRGKQHELFEAALTPSPARAARRAREVFSRCKPDERQALWLALADLAPVETFPWHPDGSTALADLVEAQDLFPPEDLR